LRAIHRAAPDEAGFGACAFLLRCDAAAPDAGLGAAGFAAGVAAGAAADAPLAAAAAADEAATAADAPLAPAAAAALGADFFLPLFSFASFAAAAASTSTGFGGTFRL
jgi:hypothetical protein